MSLYIPFAVFALVLHSTSAAKGSTCTDAEIGTYILGLPEGVACASAHTQLLSVPSDTDLLTVCSANCGRPLVEHQLLACNDTTGLFTVLSCLRTNGTSTLGDYCRYSFPDQPGVQDILANLTACAGFPGYGMCLVDCVAALNDAQAAFGCCYRHLYADPGILYSFVVGGLLSAENVTFLLEVIANASLREACNVSMPDFCTGELFPSNSGEIIGVCDEMKFGSFVERELTETCKTNIYVSLDDATLNDVDFDSLCSIDCAGKLADYERDTCKSEFHATLTEISCLEAEGASVGDRCRYAYAAQVIEEIFTKVGVYCISETPENCGPGCAGALQDLSSKMGCCYQTIFNDTFLGLSFLLFSETYDISSLFFFDIINNPVLWDNCNIPLIEKCSEKPFSSAISFAASTAVLALVQLAVFLLI